MKVRAGRWTALYFVMYMLFCATMMFDVLVGVVIEGFRVSIRGPDDDQHQATAGYVPFQDETAADNESDGTLSGELQFTWMFFVVVHIIPGYFWYMLVVPFRYKE